MKGATVFAAAVVLACVAAAQLPSDADLAALDRHIAVLVEQLGDPQFAVRQRAQQELVKLGFDAFDALVEAENADDPEVAMQAGYLVRRIRAQWTEDSDPRPVQQILNDYEVQNDDRRLAKIKQLATLEDDLGLRWLCRLVRFERSPVLSKQAALAIIENQPADEAGWNGRRETIQKELVRARRPAARWLDAYLAAHADPAAALDAWSKLAEEEGRTLRQHPRETHSQIVMALLRRQVEMLDQLGRGDETGEVMRRMVLCERGDSSSLAELINWLSTRQAWDVVDLVAERFAASFDVDAVLLYTLCDARVAQGNQELAEATAQRALKIGGETQEEHAQLADRLGDRGLLTWANREWRHVIELGPIGTHWDVFARDILANNLHDQRRDAEAGELLKQLIEEAEKDADVMKRLRAAQQQVEANIGINLLRANMYYYLSCHAEAEGDAAARRELLEKAVECDGRNVEVLIALYHLTEEGSEERAELMKLIGETVDWCRNEIEDRPESPTYYNQIAWLVSNTEGDYDEALELSQKSIELARPTSDSPRRLGGLLDTLSHCYYAKGEYANAVKTQEEAARLDPHTQSIRRALGRFREALAEEQAINKNK